MIKTKLKVGDPVELLDISTSTGKKKGNGYSVTAITKNYIECTHNTLPFGKMDKSVYYGKNDLHLIKSA